MINEQVESQALLIHRHTTTGNVDVTSHKVITLADGKSYTLGAGRVFGAADKEALVSILQDTDSTVDFIDESILVKSNACIAWFTQPKVVDVPFRGESITAPIPGLVFIASNSHGLRCFAFKGRGRPTRETKLYYPPLGNVYRAGSFCTGNSNVSRDVLISNIPAWEGFVLEATSTHLGDVAPLRGVKTFDELVEFYRGLRDSGAKSFPTAKLAKVTQRLAGQPQATLIDVLKDGVQ